MKVLTKVGFGVKRTTLNFQVQVQVRVTGKSFYHAELNSVKCFAKSLPFPEIYTK